MLSIGVWTFLRVYKQVEMNMSMARDPRGVKVNATAPHPHTPTCCGHIWGGWLNPVQGLGFTDVVVEVGRHMVCTFLNKMTT